MLPGTDSPYYFLATLQETVKWSQSLCIIPTLMHVKRTLQVYFTLLCLLRSEHRAVTWGRHIIPRERSRLKREYGCGLSRPGAVYRSQVLHPHSSWGNCSEKPTWLLGICKLDCSVDRQECHNKNTVYVACTLSHKQKCVGNRTKM